MAGKCSNDEGRAASAANAHAAGGVRSSGKVG